MKYLDDLPKRHPNHIIESKAVAAFEKIIHESECFMIQQKDTQDYGTDYQLEVADDENATNVRIHVQLKGTKKALNKDGSISIDINRTNLNYLISQRHSFFVCYHIPTNTLKFCYADTVLRQYEHSKQQWTTQQTITVNFTDLLTITKLQSLAKLAKANSNSVRNNRIKQITTSPSEMVKTIKTIPFDLHIPEDQDRAASLLLTLYNSGEDKIISDAFDRFLAIFPSDHNAIMYCYMAEINIGMAQKEFNIDRVKKGVIYLESTIETKQFSSGSLLYSIGNGYSVLDLNEDAIIAYKKSIDDLEERDSQLLAMCYKNLGSSYENIGNQSEAVTCYKKSISYNKQLPEANFALGNFYLKNGKYEEALQHFDEIVFNESTTEKQFSVLGWRVNALFNLKEGRSAFREINTLLSDTSNNGDWIWLWCAKQVALFGRDSIDNAKQSISFWNRYLKKHPDCPYGVREWLPNQFYLRSESQNIEFTYTTFKSHFESMIKYIQNEDAAFLWDRLGHWAQDNNDWNEAEYCFRNAYDLAKGEYGYCLGTALLFLNRPKESLPLLLEQALKIQPDDMSWFQVASTYERLGKIKASINAYKKVISLNSEHALAWFNMGGIHWNNGDHKNAIRVWKKAIKKFPNHELSVELYKNIPYLLD
ncbi:tetratricopeptide repeat protein [Acinetobacter sp. VNK23]|uniref:tetratricopeptide repeat protein n=1 Tax=Acinetobacter thutiue TaxID=2998078 RepID=UPI0025767353|nr:tetratricopeptide repeat protein [Acinetobacter thutiue]MDM1020355.1 tetratricopeptide repeat protein [Acinetobacter thutiue]